jgi:biofilm PGA synthesis N-glycosyltransferase PgaC
MAILVAALSIALLVYVILVYPLLLGWLARHREPERGSSSWIPTVSVILPVYNGEAFIQSKLATLFALDYPADRVQIVMISDGSTDATDELIGVHGGGRVELIRVPRRGKAMALNVGLERATGEVLFFTDIRQELSSNALRDLVARLADPDVGVATGELVIRSGNNGDGAGLYWRYEVWIRLHLSRLGVLQGATGCIYAMRREYARPLPENTLADDVYLPLAAFMAGKTIVLEPDAKAFDHPVRDLRVEFRRKIRTLAGMYQVIGAYPGLLWPGTRGWLHFMSHKAGRLALPFALIALLISSFSLPEPFRAWLLGCQAVVYGLALLDFVLPRGFPLKRITAAASAFVVLMAAALCSTLALFVPARLLWKQTAIRRTQT